MTFPAPPRRRRSPIAVGLGCFGLVAALLVAGAVLVVWRARDDGADGPSRTGPIDVLIPANVARDTAIAQPAPLPAGIDVEAWAATTAARTGVPARALQADAAAEMAQRVATPKCGLTWVTLAGIARVESHHGRLDGAHLDADGVARPTIVGPRLDGTAGTRKVADTDHGALDGDTTFDHAVGPFQFLPATWARWGADGNGDGVKDPNQIDDAARGAAAYLCSGKRNMADGAGWWDGVLTYNQSLDYARLVWTAATQYAP